MKLMTLAYYVGSAIIALLLLSSSIVLLTPIDKSYAATCSSTSAFKLTVKTDNSGTSDASSFTIPTTGSGYSYKVDINGNNNWLETNAGAGWNETTNRTSASTINFGSPGTYQISICGNFPRIYFNNGGDRNKLLSIDQWGDNAWTNMTSAFYGATNLDVKATDTPNFSNVIGYASMFREATALIGNSSFSTWNTVSGTNTSYMFYGAVNFNQPIGNWNTSNVLQMHYMFHGASSFNQPIGNWDTSKVTSMTNMFREALAFNQPIGTWNVGNVNNFSHMFRNAPAFNQPIGNWNLTSATNLQYMFYDASSFNQPIGNWNIGNVTNTQYLFSGATAFNQPLADWNMSNVTSTAYMFNRASAFDQDLSNWDVSNVETMQYMFRDVNQYNYPIGNWNVSKVTNMSYMFFNASLFNQPLDNWDVSSVTTMANMFRGAASFNQPLNNWDVSSVTSMTYMFRDATSFNQPLGNWNVSNVTTMSYMFSGASVFNQPVETWNVGNITDMTYLFNNTSAFNQPLNNWDVSGATDMTGMFRDALAFNQPLNNWDVSNVVDMSAMFRGTTVFNQPLNNWDVHNVTNMRDMFASYKIYAINSTRLSITNVQTAFNQDLSMWNTSRLTDMAGIFNSEPSEMTTYYQTLGYTNFEINDDTSILNPYTYSLANWNISQVTTMQAAFSGSHISTEAYDNMLTTWASKLVQPGVKLGALGVRYCSEDAYTARQSLIANHSWSITDAGLGCFVITPPAPSPSGTISFTNASTGLPLTSTNPATDPVQHSTTLPVRLSITPPGLSSPLPLAEVEATFEDNLNWSVVKGAVDLDTFSSVISNLNTSESQGVAVTHSLFIPMKQGDNGVVICPYATVLNDVKANCPDAISMLIRPGTTTTSQTAIISSSTPPYSLSINLSLSLVAIDGRSYWKVSGLVGTGGMSAQLTDTRTSSTVPLSPNTGFSHNYDESVSIIELFVGSLIICSLMTFAIQKYRYVRHENLDFTSVK